MGPSMWTQLSRLPQPAPKRRTSWHEQPWACPQPQPGGLSRSLLLRREGAGGGEAAPEVRLGKVGGALCSPHAQRCRVWLWGGGAGGARVVHHQLPDGRLGKLAGAPRSLHAQRWRVPLRGVSAGGGRAAPEVSAWAWSGERYDFACLARDSVV